MTLGRMPLAALFACGLSLVSLGASGLAHMDDDYTALASEEETSGDFVRTRCYGINCPSVLIGTCRSNELCCGWVNCGDTSQKSVKCCSSSEVCHDGLHTNPPSQAQCVGTP